MDPIPADAFYDLTTIDRVTVSPDGRRVASVTSEFDPASEDGEEDGGTAGGVGASEPDGEA